MLSEIILVANDININLEKKIWSGAMKHGVLMSFVNISEKVTIGKKKVHSRIFYFNHHLNKSLCMSYHILKVLIFDMEYMIFFVSLRLLIFQFMVSDFATIFIPNELVTNSEVIFTQVIFL